MIKQSERLLLIAELIQSAKTQRAFNEARMHDYLRNPKRNPFFDVIDARCESVRLKEIEIYLKSRYKAIIIKIIEKL